MLPKVEIAKLSIIMNWIMSFEILALSRRQVNGPAHMTLIPFTWQQMGLSHTLNKLSSECAASSEWFRSCLILSSSRTQGTYTVPCTDRSPDLLLFYFLLVYSLSAWNINVFLSNYVLWGLPERRRRCRGWRPEVSGLQAS